MFFFLKIDSFNLHVKFSMKRLPQTFLFFVLSKSNLQWNRQRITDLTISDIIQNKHDYGSFDDTGYFFYLFTVQNPGI